jgi:SAM-dependent methyltransferase
LFFWCLLLEEPWLKRPDFFSKGDVSDRLGFVRDPLGHDNRPLSPARSIAGTRQMNWFHRLYEGRESFDDKEEERAYREKQRALTNQEANDLVQLLKLASGSRILDAYCGNGRHAILLAQRGFHVIGVDSAFSRIAFARNWARDEGIDALFLVADARAPCLQGVFDAVLVVGGSFTHCLEDEENIALLTGLRAVLRPGGVLLIDNPNPVRFWRIQNPEGTLAEQEALRYFDLPLGDGKAAGFVRYHSPVELKRLFHEAHLEVQGIFGTRSCEPYSSESPRMILVGQICEW